ncbi:MAG: hypothetical protein RIC18_08235 [Hoeflea sp.]
MNAPACGGNHSLTLFLKRFAKNFAYSLRTRPAEAAGGVLKQKWMKEPNHEDHF